MKYAVGVDIGGTNSRIALVDENMNIVERTQFRTDAHDPIPTIVRLSEALKDMAGDKELVGMGVSCPGPLDLINGKVLNTPNLHDSWQDFPIAGEIERGEISFIKGDIGDSALVSGILHDYLPDYIINFAAESHVDRSLTDSRPFFTTNV